MLQRIRPRLTYANVIATLALFIVLGGGAYATIDRKIGPRDIRKGAVTTPKIKGKAVKPGKLAANSVRSPKIAEGAVTGAKVADGAISTGKLSDGAVTTEKLSNGAVSTDKLSDAAVSDSKLANPLFSAVVAANGNLVRGSAAVTSSTRLGTGLYEVRFDRDLSACSWIGQIGSPDGVPVASGEVSTSLRAPNDAEGLLLIVNGSNGVVADRPFHLLVHC